MLSRRSFLAAGAAATAGPALGATAQKKAAVPDDRSPEVVVVGAGAAGIAAARRLVAAGRRVVVLEATDAVGGRCITDTTTFGVPFDRGAHWIHTPEINPVAKLARETGLDIYPAPPGQRVRIGRRYAREGEMEDMLAGLVQAQRAIGEATRRGDVSCAQALPKALGDWRPTIEFILGPFNCSKDLADISAADFSKSLQRNVDAFCRQGLGALVAKLAAGLPVRLASPVTAIRWGSRAGGVEVESGRTELRARTVIVTASTSVLDAGGIDFRPDLPRRQTDAFSKLRLGHYDHIALELSGNPLGLRADELVFEKSTSSSTAALFANASGSSLCTVEVAGSFGRDLAARGEAAMIEFALQWLSGLYGTDLRPAVRRSQATNWAKVPYVLGGFSAAAPGAQGARRALMEAVNNRIWFAGDAAHETLWGTVGGAWESGERAADAVLRTFVRR
jgi:monoamine oxidase